jgi:hypothetical protein
MNGVLRLHLRTTPAVALKLLWGLRGLEQVKKRDHQLEYYQVLEKVMPRDSTLIPTGFSNSLLILGARSLNLVES